MRLTARGRSEQGMTLVELMLAMAILAIAALGLITALVGSIRLQVDNRELDLAANAARSVIETMRANPDFSQTFSVFNEDGEDDPDGPGTAVGNLLPLTYGVGTLDNPYTSAASSLLIQDAYATSIQLAKTTQELVRNETLRNVIVEVEFPGGGTTLREDTVDPLLGMPRDLNGDGDTLDDAATDYVILPVRVTLTWNGLSGPMTYEISTYLTKR